MQPINILLMRNAASVSHLDSQTVTVGADGTAGAQNRRRGFISGTLGSISDGTSNVYSGAAITQLYWDENVGAPFYQLAITGAANSGWTSITINGTKTLTRASAGFAAGVWNWSTADTSATQAFGASGSVVVTFD